MAEYSSSSNAGNVSLQLINDNREPKGIDQAQKYVYEKAFAFWARKAASILTADTVVFALVSSYKFVKISITGIIDHLKELDMFDRAKSVCHLPNVSFHYIHFDSRESAEEFTNRSNFIHQQRVQFVTGRERIRQCRIQVENFPPDLVESLLPDVIKHVGTVVKVMPQTVPCGKGKECQIGRTTIDFLFHESKSLVDLPYHVQLLGHKVFLFVPSRPRICYRCSSTQHVVANCGVRYCRTCHGLRPVGHTCTLSYADRVAGPVSSWEERNAMFHEDAALAQLATDITDEVVQTPPSATESGPSDAIGLHGLPIDDQHETSSPASLKGLPADATVFVNQNDENSPGGVVSSDVLPLLDAEQPLGPTLSPGCDQKQSTVMDLIDLDTSQGWADPVDTNSQSSSPSVNEPNPSIKSRATPGKHNASVAMATAQRDQTTKRKTKLPGRYSSLLTPTKNEDDRPAKTKKAKRADPKSPPKQTRSTKTEVGAALLEPHELGSALAKCDALDPSKDLLQA